MEPKTLRVQVSVVFINNTILAGNIKRTEVSPIVLNNKHILTILDKEIQEKNYCFFACVIAHLHNNPKRKMNLIKEFLSSLPEHHDDITNGFDVDKHNRLLRTIEDVHKLRITFYIYDQQKALEDNKLQCEIYKQSFHMEQSNFTRVHILIHRNKDGKDLNGSSRCSPEHRNQS